MAEEKVELTKTEEGVKPTEQQPKEDVTGMVTISKADYESMQKALKETNAENAKRRKAMEAAEAETKAQADAKLSEMEKLAKRAAELEAKLQAKERADNQRTVAEKVGIPLVLASRLIGNTPEELEADAKALLETLPKVQKPQPGVQPTSPSNSTGTGNTDNERRARIYGGGVANIFDEVKQPRPD
jgi:phage-related minor tail protein